MALGWRGNYLRYRDFFLNMLLVYRKRPDLKMFLEASLSLLTIFVFAVFALRPTLITIATLVREIRTKEELVTKMDEKIANLDAAEVVYVGAEQQINIVKTAIPLSPEPDTFLRQIEGLSQNTSARVLGVSFGEVTLFGSPPEKRVKEELKPLPEGAKPLSFSVSVTADFPTLSKFLTEIANLRRPVAIDAAAINSSQVPEGTILTLVISARTPYIKTTTPESVTNNNEEQ